ncbi:MAG: toprim domain-containing protein [Sphingobacteriales bacterium]|nr:toprim domain-containing protein [Sphingobacteriales bacterium]MBI3717588.1 toprim domain-containing protein [Sphingobacteriales bacterium]
MKAEQNISSFKEAKQIDLVEYLSTLGFEPAKIRNNDYWYLSPLRDEKTPSFKVDRKINYWYDHGLGKGGNIIDFGMLYFNCTGTEFIKKLNSNFSLHQPIKAFSAKETAETKIIVLGDFMLSSTHLTNYLTKRKIPFDIADKYCREVRYQMSDKVYYGIGFKTDSGSFEIRNPFLKSASSPKSITTFKNGSNEVSVFEGFFDFLSYKFLEEKNSLPNTDYIVLNSLSFFEKSRVIMENYKQVKLYLDNDKAGQNCSRLALSLSNKYKDESSFYQNHKDLNDWLVNNELRRQKRIGRKI